MFHSSHILRNKYSANHTHPHYYQYAKCLNGYSFLHLKWLTSNGKAHTLVCAVRTMKEGIAVDLTHYTIDYHYFFTTFVTSLIQNFAVLRSSNWNFYSNKFHLNGSLMCNHQSVYGGYNYYDTSCFGTHASATTQRAVAVADFITIYKTGLLV